MPFLLPNQQRQSTEGITINIRRSKIVILRVVAMAWWRNGRASDLRSRGREFDPRPGHGCVTTLGKLFIPNCLDSTLTLSLVYRVVKLDT